MDSNSYNNKGDYSILATLKFPFLMQNIAKYPTASQVLIFGKRVFSNMVISISLSAMIETLIPIVLYLCFTFLVFAE